MSTADAVRQTGVTQQTYYLFGWLSGCKGGDYLAA
jgi:hypothetical protein